MAAKIPIPPLTLDFSEELKPVFFDDYFQKSLIQVRFSLLIAIVFYAICGVLELWISPEIKVIANVSDPIVPQRRLQARALPRN
jgi:hypothetical protein